MGAGLRAPPRAVTGGEEDDERGERDPGHQERRHDRRYEERDVDERQHDELVADVFDPGYGASARPRVKHGWSLTGSRSPPPILGPSGCSKVRSS